MNNTLRNFYGNEIEREAVRTFQLQMLRELAADLAVEGKDTKGIKDAVEAIQNSFDKLHELYGKAEPPTVISSR